MKRFIILNDQDEDIGHLDLEDDIDEEDLDAIEDALAEAGFSITEPA